MEERIIKLLQERLAAILNATLRPPKDLADATQRLVLIGDVAENSVLEVEGIRERQRELAKYPVIKKN